MSKRARSALLALFCCAPVLYAGGRAQTQSAGVVRGRIVDGRGAPVVRVKVTLGASWGYSDTTGRYVLSRVPYGTYRIVLERDGRKIDKAQVEVRARITDVPDLKWP